MSIQIYTAKISKTELLKLPKKDQELLFSLSHFCNEVTMLLKVILLSANNKPINEAERDGRFTFIFFFLQLLAGKLFAGFELLTNKFFTLQSSNKYSSFLTPEGKQQLDYLKNYFSKSNILKPIRNYFSAHYSGKGTVEAFPDISDDLVLYSEKGSRGNNLFYFAEVASIHALLNLIEPNNSILALKILIDETTDISSKFLRISEEIIIAILEKNLTNFWDGYSQEVEFQHVPEIQNISLPWFIDNTEFFLKY